MTWWPRKPEPPKEEVINWRLVKFFKVCDDCESVVVETIVPMVRVSCEKCQAAIKAVHGLSWSEIDHYGEYLVCQGVLSVDSPEEE